MWSTHSLDRMAREGPSGGDAGAKTRRKWEVHQHTGLVETMSDSQRSAGRPERLQHRVGTCQVAANTAQEEQGQIWWAHLKGPRVYSEGDR